MFTIAVGEYKDKNTIEKVFIGDFYCIKGEKFNFEGQWVMNKTYGEQFKVEKYEKINTLNCNEIITYLKQFKGIGEVRARKIVDAFKEKTLTVISTNHHELTKIGISEKIAEEIFQYVSKNTIMSELNSLLKITGISLKTVNKIYKKYGNNSKKIIEKNPYQLIKDIGINFNVIDYYAKKIGFDKNCNIRVQAVIEYALYLATKQGHSFLFVMELIDSIQKTIDNIHSSIIVKNLIDMEEEKKVIIESDTAVYLPEFYYAEQYISEKIKRIREKEIEKNTAIDFNKLIKKLENENKIKYAEQQRKAIKLSLSEKILVLTGGPGTGKTTTLNGIIKAIIKSNSDIDLGLAAPTGKAAKRMEEITKMPAKTIHRMLEYKPFDGELYCGRNEENPIQSDVIIIDEFSMVDVLLLEKFLRAIKIDTKIIIVGDVDQLPSVGAGNVLKDLIKSGVIKTVKLDTIFRQKETSSIIENVYKINKGEYPIFSQKDFIFNKIDDENIVAKELVKKYIQHKNEDVQILTPFKKKTVCGSNNLNFLIQEAINPLKHGEKEIKIGKYIYRTNDKVIQTKNNYEKLCFNGDTGIITNIVFAGDPVVTVKFDDGKEIEFVGREEIMELELAYALTIHKSQGSEYKIVLIPVVMSHKRMLARNLIYTGITRAKEQVILYGTEEALKIAINNASVSKRNSKLYYNLI